jgi:GAF domain-containing protein
LVEGDLDRDAVPGVQRRSYQISRVIETERAAELAGEAALRWRAALLSSTPGPTSEASLDKALRGGLAAVRELVDSDTASLLIADERGELLIARASVGLSESISAHLQIPVGAGVAGRVFGSAVPLVIDDLAEVELVSSLLSDDGVRALAVVPVVANDRVIGVLHAGSFTPAFFGPDDLAALSVVASRLGAAMDRVERFEAERRAKVQAEHVAVLMTRLQRITAAVSADAGVNDAARSICREVTASSADWIAGCTMWMVAGDALELVQPDEAPESARHFVRMPLASGYPGCEVVQSNEPLWIESAAAMENRFPNMVGAQTLGNRFAVLPLRSAVGAFGVLAYSFDETGPFAQHERDFLLAVAEQASHAFERARQRDLQRRAAQHDAVLAQLSGSLALSLDLGVTTSHVVDSLVPGLADVAAIHLFDSAGQLKRAGLRHIDPGAEAQMLASGGTDSPAILAALATAAALRELTALDGMDLSQARPGSGLAEQVAQSVGPIPVSSALVVRLTDRGRVIGTLSVARLGASPAIKEDDHPLYIELARRAAVAIANAQLHRELNVGLRTERFLLGVARSVAGATGYIETIQRLATAAVPTLGDLCLIDLLDDSGDGLQRAMAYHSDPAVAALVRQLWHRYPPDIGGNHPSAAVVRHGKPVLVSEVPDAELRSYCRDDAHFAILKQLGWQSLMAVPLTAGEQILGTLTLVSAGSGRRFEIADLQVAQRLASQVGAVVQQARRYDREHRISHVLQASLLPPEVPHLSDMDLAVRYVAGTTDAEVGGDFYDAIALPSGVLAIAVGDVAGHDHQAAAAMGHLRSAIRTLSSHLDGPAEVVDTMQRHWELLGLQRLASAIVAQIDPQTGDVVIVSAGHPPPLLLSDQDASLVPVPTGPPLGAPGATVDAWHGTMDHDTTLLFYTDGVLGRRQVDTSESLRDLADVAGKGPRDVESVCDRILASLANDRDDDIALLAVGRR